MHSLPTQLFLAKMASPVQFDGEFWSFTISDLEMLKQLRRYLSLKSAQQKKRLFTGEIFDISSTFF